MDMGVKSDVGVVDGSKLREFIVVIIRSYKTHRLAKVLDFGN